MVLSKKKLVAILDAEIYRRQHNLAPSKEQILDQSLSEIDNLLTAIETIKQDPNYTLDMDHINDKLNRIYVLLKALQYALTYETKS